ncbi:CU044_5270 family protein [Actinoplanes subtropicus]|uniref:CU044_5270 family protein n=1 Tax=Actinoplanes subtropicus TaxID=543632 RepID=UPI00068F373B|nr:CU044_5270 family protein [Actinoplanes subtropicus]
MSDLDLVERFRADLPPAEPAVLSRARARMFHDPAPRRRARWQWGLIPAGALAAVVAAAVVLGGTGHAPVPTPPAAHGSPGSPATDAAGVLRLAAAEARRDPLLTARPDQFLYVESRVAWAGATTALGNSATPGTIGTTGYQPPVEKLRRVWLSVDGTRPGLLRQQRANGGKVQTIPLGNEDAPGVRLPSPYRDDLPTDATAMRAYLYSAKPDPARKSDLSPDTMAFTKVGDTLREEYVPPRAVAALFEAAATIPGTTVKKQADLSGRRGIAVCRADQGQSYELIFDASTYAFLGERDVVAGDHPGLPKDAVLGWTAQLRMAIVDRAGQLP